ncbi:hypothetical protein DL764_006850 [Monosporascus ibericus]|uniref:Uncharacterized protein n=1 Tax=Monosporascus ibericus TaxID=155417 RepID=A0A4Q4T3N2_9PEZI|nr:hypothetical protein DL764_006850 [Monosporascus ibericus]
MLQVLPSDRQRYPHRRLLPRSRHRNAQPHRPPRPPAPTPTLTPSAAPDGSPSFRSVYRDVEDRRRAALQTAYATLAPGGVAQDAWAARKAGEFAPCPYNLPWLRDGAHCMSDMILVEGMSGLYATRCHQGLRNWDRGPTEQERVPPGYYDPIGPVGVDKRGRYAYFEKSVDCEKTSLRKQIEPTAFGWS